MRGVWGTSRSQELPYLLPSAGQRLTLDHFFVANAQLLLLPSASLSRREPGGETRQFCHLGILGNAKLHICKVPTGTAKLILVHPQRHGTCGGGGWVGEGGTLVSTNVTLFTFLQAGTGASRTGSYMGIWGRGGGRRWSRLGRESPFLVKDR